MAPSCHCGAGGEGDALHLLQHLGAGEVVVDAVLEGAGDDRQPEHADRAQAGQAGRAVEVLLGREGDLGLDVLGRLPGPQGDDLDVDVVGVGERLDRQLPVGVQPADHQQRHQRQRDDPLVQGEIDEFLNHDPQWHSDLSACK